MTSVPGRGLVWLLFATLACSPADGGSRGDDASPPGGAASGGVSGAPSGAGGVTSGGAGGVTSGGAGGVTSGGADGAGGVTSGGADGVGGVTSGGADGGAGGGASAPCASLPLCDGFESAVPGGPPDPATWTPTVLTNCGSTAAPPTVTDAVHHGGSRSLAVVGQADYCGYSMVGNAAAVAAAGDAVFGRFYVRFEAPLPAGHTGFLAFVDRGQGGRALRMGGQNGALQWNREEGDPTLPEQSPAGIASSVAPEAGRWYCIEFEIDQADARMTTWVDGKLVDGLTSDGEPTRDLDEQWQRGEWTPDLESVNFGWQNYGGGTMRLWFDDVAIGATRIGCEWPT